MNPRKHRGRRRRRELARHRRPAARLGDRAHLRARGMRAIVGLFLPRDSPPLRAGVVLAQHGSDATRRLLSGAAWSSPSSATRSATTSARQRAPAHRPPRRKVLNRHNLDAPNGSGPEELLRDRRALDPVDPHTRPADRRAARWIPGGAWRHQPRRTAVGPDARPCSLLRRRPAGRPAVAEDGGPVDFAWRSSCWARGTACSATARRCADRSTNRTTRRPRLTASSSGSPRSRAGCHRGRGTR